MTKRRTLQQIFNLAISSGYYNKSINQIMCCAIDRLAVKELITDAEKIKARAAINKYIGQVKLESGGSVVTLEIALKLRKLPHEFNDRLAIYKDWANRPTLSLRKIREQAQDAIRAAKILF